MSEDFDDLNVYRRQVEKLKQENGDLGEIIGVLKKEKADLYLCLMDVISFHSTSSINREAYHQAFHKAQEALTKIKID